ncbi:MAG: xanthine dehydrogenase family protein molybdopterin-binding subunit [Candidatus Solibacter usitatus]|nr:xanthine dehydrogenase family protein molybdopterin-binding subunit [Candidatus Solibacter usitatus]
MANYNWPEMKTRAVMGKRYTRQDGLEKSTGRAKYNSDLNKPGMLQSAFLTSPYAHAKIRSIDTSAAEKLAGVTAVRVIVAAGAEVNYQSQEIALVAATSEQIARDAVRLIKVDFEVLPHVVKEDDLSKVGNRAKPAGEQVTGDPDKAMKEADVVSEGMYGIPVLTHCCLEPHGQVSEWKGDGVNLWPSTQNVTGIGPDLAKNLEVPATQVKVHMDYIGGGFGSKFASDRWGVEGTKLSKASGGRPVKVFLDRATELNIAGNRPSAFAKIKIAAKKDGTITAWDSVSWATGGMTGGGMPPIPYAFTNIPNRRLNHTAVQTNGGPLRAWRAPNHPQASFLTCAALEDLASKLGMDPLELFAKNVQYAPEARRETYLHQLKKAAELSDWSKRWHRRGDSGAGPIKRGMGIGLCTWGGAGHASTCKATIHPDGSVEVELGSQDLGTGTRTIVGQVAAETLGLPLEAVKVKLGDNSYPPSNASGGSTTVGGVSSSTRIATADALDKLFAKVAPSLNSTADKLEAVGGKIQVKGDASKSIQWAAACKKLGVESASATGSNDPRNPKGLNTQGVAGVQIADVSVDVETGVVKMNKMVAVQDCGLVVNPRLAESQVLGACIMSVCGALMEERVMDNATGRVLNPEMEFYKLAGIGDIGDIVVHMDIREENDKRGIIGLGEPPTIGGIAAIANAVANAIGVRVPSVPLTPDRVLAALEERRSA